MVDRTLAGHSRTEHSEFHGLDFTVLEGIAKCRTESRTPPDGSRTPPGGSRTPPGGSRTPPGGSRMPPAWEDHARMNFLFRKWTGCY